MIKATASSGFHELYHARLGVFRLSDLQLESDLLCEFLAILIFDLAGELDTARGRALTVVVTFRIKFFLQFADNLFERLLWDDHSVSVCSIKLFYD